MTDPLAQIEARKVVGGRTLLTEEERDALVEIAKAAQALVWLKDGNRSPTYYAAKDAAWDGVRAALSVLDDREET